VYVPASFRENRVPLLHDMIRRIRLGALVTLGAEGLVASHLPLLIDAEPAPFGRLSGHMARANPQARSLDPKVQALVVFTGPEAYISPSWYPTKQLTGKVVPTWNYVAIHAYGTLRFIDDPAVTLAHVTRLTETQETPRAQPWQVADAPGDFIAGMVKAIIGFELVITRLEGKWKMSQNRPAEDRAGVVEGLAREGGSAEVAELVAGLSAPAED
jgi:transcriptional regulator